MAKKEVYSRPAKSKMPKGTMKAKKYPPAYKTYKRPRQRKKAVT